MKRLTSTFHPLQASEEAIREREKILEAAGQLVASMESSQRNNKEKRLSTGNNLEAITEEKDTKNDTHDLGEGDEATDDTTPKADNSTAVPDKNLDILQDSSLLEDNVEDVLKGDEKVTSSQKNENNEVTQEDSSIMEDQPSTSEVTQSIIDMEGIPSASPPNPEQESSSSSSSDDDDDANAALSNLEGFTPLVGMKFKK